MLKTSVVAPAVAALVIVAALFVPTVSPADTGSGGIGAGGPAPGGSSPAATGGSFPVAGRFTYGDGLGAGRGHQGQDILASCGKRVVAAESGVVRFVDYQANGAGNYAVVKGPKRTFDYVYMHMSSRPLVSVGERVRAGETIGLVGSTGRSSACHLHFEMWAAPGWYRGGRMTDPLPYLQRWES